MSSLASRLSLRVKLLLTFVAVFTIALGVFAVLALSTAYNGVTEVAVAQNRDNIEYIARELLPFLVPGEYFVGEDYGNFLAAGEAGDYMHYVIWSYLRLARGADENVRIHTILNAEGGTPVYAVSTEHAFEVLDDVNMPYRYDADAEVSRPLRAPYEDPARYAELFKGLESKITVKAPEDQSFYDVDVEPVIEDIHVDDKGLWATAYTPITLVDGTMIGIAWIDAGPLNIADVPRHIVNAGASTAVVVYPVLIVVVVVVALTIAHPLRKLTNASEVVEKGDKFTPDLLEDIAGRGDELGQLARIFSHMAVEVQAREEKLKQQVQELKIEIDMVKKEKSVKEITDTDFFRDLQSKAKRERETREPGEAEAKPEPAPAADQAEGAGDDFLAGLQSKARAARARKPEPPDNPDAGA
ncbi:MAG: HAMP domain-containing protein [Anaerolineae bacterium]|nr:HAMP domain-containing protein [Anaerolineae bacterium]